MFNFTCNDSLFEIKTAVLRLAHPKGVTNLLKRLVSVSGSSQKKHLCALKGHDWEWINTVEVFSANFPHKSVFFFKMFFGSFDMVFMPFPFSLF